MSTTTDQPTDEARRKTQTWVLIVAALASFMAALDTIVVATSLGTIKADLGATLEQLEWTVNAYNLTFAVLLMPAAVLGDRFGRRRLFAFGLTVFAVGSAACALAPDPLTLIFARALQGVGGALIATLSLVLVNVAFPPEKRGQALGLYFAITGLGIVAGPLVGGAIAQGLSWHWIFWLNVPIGLAIVPLALSRVPESRGPVVPLDLPGLALVTAGVLGLVWGLVRGNPSGWGSAEVVIPLVAGGLLIAAFIAWQLRARSPLLPLELFRSRGFSAGNAAIFCTVGALFCGVFFIAQFLQNGLGFGPFQAGAGLLPWTATLFFVAPVAGTFVDRYGGKWFLVAGPLMQAAGMGWIALIAHPGIAYLSLVPPLMLAGVGVSMSFPAAQTIAVGAAPPEMLGVASGTNSTVRELGGVFGIAISAAVFAAAGGYTSPGEFSDGFVAAMGASAVLSFLGACAGAALPGRGGSPAPIGAAADGPTAEALLYEHA